MKGPEKSAYMDHQRSMSLTGRPILYSLIEIANDVLINIANDMEEVNLSQLMYFYIYTV